MTRTTSPWTTHSVPVLLTILLAALAAAPASGAPPPADRSYMVSFDIPPVGDDPGETVTDCLTFTQEELCITELGECAPWIYTPVEGDKRPAFKSIFRFVDDEGAAIELHIRGVTERRGDPGSAIGGVVAGVVVEGGVRFVINIGFAGRAVASCDVFEAPQD